MATELSLLSMTQLQKQRPEKNIAGKWRWPRRRTGEEDESWEVKAFAEDTNSALGTTWPPRSYTCTFCRREFRSAQALGGHMNVHRRDRAKLRQSFQASEQSSPVMFKPPEFVVKGDHGAFHSMSFFYSFPVIAQSPVTGKRSETSESGDGGGGAVVEEGIDLELRLGW